MSMLMDGPSWSEVAETAPVLFATHLAKAVEANKHLRRRYEQLLRSEKYYDCVFNVGSSKLKCHKLILMAASPVFEAMFYGPAHEKGKEIDIVDVDADIFQQLLNYIYSGCMNFEKLTITEVIKVCYCAEKYILAELKNDCLMAVKNKLRFSNILSTLELSNCMNIQGLKDVCSSFFARCCLTDPQFKAYLKDNYSHISKQCLKEIIIAHQSHNANDLIWFVAEWCHQQCATLDLQEHECELVILELQREMNLPSSSVDLTQLHQEQYHPRTLCHLVERNRYRACRPFIVSSATPEWSLVVKSDRFVSLWGIIINSRIIPPTLATQRQPPSMDALPMHYNENLLIEIRSYEDETVMRRMRGIGDLVSMGSDIGEDGDCEGYHFTVNSSIIFQYSIKERLTKYNCDLNIQWDKDVVLSPDIFYHIKIIWPASAYGAEYPCSILSDEMHGIKFADFKTHYGSLFKGLHIVNLI